MGRENFGTVRVTGGEFRGLKLATPGRGTHPMGARERLALFNMALRYVPGGFVMDAYAGSGALGIEALSRGARSVTFVEKSAAACKVILGNLELLGDVAGNASVQNCDVMALTDDNIYDVIIADPPYDNFRLDEIVFLVGWLAKGGALILSHPGEAPEIKGLCLLRSRKYAGAHISIYVK